MPEPRLVARSSAPLPSPASLHRSHRTLCLRPGPAPDPRPPRPPPRLRLAAPGPRRALSKGRSPPCVGVVQYRGGTETQMPWRNPAARKSWKKSHPDKVQEQRRRYYEAHKDAVRERAREYARSHRDVERGKTPAAKATKRRYYERTRKERLAQVRAWGQSEAGKDARRAQRTREREREAEARRRVLMELGPVCVQCGFSDVRALQVDHVNGGGAKDRRMKGQRRYWSRVGEEIGSGKYQVLCANCNCIKG